MNSKIRANAAFTLVELLVVIAIIGILAAMVLAVVPAVTNNGKKTKAKLEAQAIATAIEQYDSAYGRFPVSQQAQAAALANVGPGNSNGSDITYGGVFVGGSVFTPGYPATNAEVIAILMDVANYAGGGSTSNTNHQKNPKNTVFLNAKLSGWDPSQGGAPQPGVGNDLVYRDPWGNPYIITMDLNYDDQCEDAFYSLQDVSKQNGQSGYNGLVNSTDANGAGNHFRYHGEVMVWSAGKGGKVDPTDPATDWENKGHVLSWR